MDGMNGPTGGQTGREPGRKGGPLRHMTVRIRHDCPLARLSQELPDVRFTAWSGHHVEVLEVALPRGARGAWERTVAAARRHLDVQRAFQSPEGGLIVADVHVPAEKSISRTFEAHRCLWLQPMVLQDGWEHYDAISFGPSEQDALDALATHGPTRVVKRRSIAPEDLTASLFLSLRPVLDAPTDKQAEALVAAGKAGYYQSPREATTAEVASGMGLGRSAFEERLRGAENRVLNALLPLLEHRRLR